MFWFLQHEEVVPELLKEVKGLTVSEVQEVITENARKLGLKLKDIYLIYNWKRYFKH